MIQVIVAIVTLLVYVAACWAAFHVLESPGLNWKGRLILFVGLTVVLTATALGGLAALRLLE